MDCPGPHISQLPHAWSEGDQGALDRLMTVVYDDLHRLAQRYMAQERPGHTLQGRGPGTRGVPAAARLHASKLDARKSHVVELRFFGGLSVKETAEVPKVSEETAQRDWKLVGGLGGIALASADYNHDGKADLAVVNNLSNNVSILLGTRSQLRPHAEATNRLLLPSGPRRVVVRGECSAAPPSGYGSSVRTLRPFGLRPAEETRMTIVPTPP